MKNIDIRTNRRLPLQATDYAEGRRPDSRRHDPDIDLAPSAARFQLLDDARDCRRLAAFFASGTVALALIALATTAAGVESAGIGLGAVAVASAAGCALCLFGNWHYTRRARRLGESHVRAHVRSSSPSP